MTLPAKITRMWTEIEFSGDELRDVLIVETSVALHGEDVDDEEWQAVIDEAQRLYSEADGGISAVRIIPVGVRNA